VKKTNKEYLYVLSCQEKQFDALYRKAAASFGLSYCAMWILYFIDFAENELTQQDLHAMMMFPKQTINSAVSKLARMNYVVLESIPKTRNSKAVKLTPSGKAFCQNTVEKLREAEYLAVENMSPEKMDMFASLYTEFFSCLEAGFQQKNLLR